jgi:hypothetical protein
VSSTFKISRSDKSLKSGNQPKLITFVIANAVGVALVLIGAHSTSQLLSELIAGSAAALLKLIGVPAGASLALGLLGWVVPASWKETLVFWRVGERRLPSSEAFTKIAPSDLRIDTSTLAHRVGTFPTDYRQQSALWYATYRKHANEMSVTDTNSAYLLHREMASLSAMLVLVAPVTGKLLHAPASRILIAAGIIGLEYLLVMLAGRNAGTRLVANVLAIESAAPLQAHETSTRRSSRRKSETKQERSPGAK